MRQDKYDRAKAVAELPGDGQAGVAMDCPTVVDAVMSAIPVEVIDALPGRLLGLVMRAVNHSYHTGRAAHNRDVKTGADIIY